MISVARGCTVLSAVVANRCPNITDATVAAFGKYSIDLARLSVKGCATITDTGLKVRGVCPQLGYEARQLLTWALEKQRLLLIAVPSRLNVV